MQRNIFDNIFWLLLSLWLLVDTINGFFLNIGVSLPVSLAFKTFFLLIVSAGLCKIYRGRFILLFLLFYIAIFFLHLSLRWDEDTLLNETFSHLSRFLSLVLVYYYVKRQILLSPLVTYNHIIRVFKVNLIVFIINIYLGLIGVGFTSYGTLGYKGFFYAGNELSGIVIVLFPFFINYMFERYSYKSIRFIFVIFALSLAVGLLGTKSSLIAFLFSTIYIYLLSDKKYSKFVKVVFFSLLLLLICWGGYYLISKLGMLDRWMFFYDRGGIGMLLLSGRGDYWIEEKNEFFNSGYAVLLFGLGGAKTVEMDVFDALLNYGYVGSFLIYSFYLYLLIENYKKRTINRTVKVLFFINMLILLSSSISGHLLFSGMANVFIALLNVLVYLPKDFFGKLCTNFK